MTRRDLEALMRGLVPALQEKVAEELAPLRTQVATLEKRIGDLEEEATKP